MSQGKKHFLSRLFMLWLLILMHGSSFTQSQRSQGQVPAGDADGDGFLTVLDRAVILDQILGLGEAAGNPDFNMDGEVNAADLAGLTEFFFETQASLASVDVSVFESVVTPGGAVKLSWEIEGDRDLSELEVRIRTREAGHVVTTTDAVFTTPGVIPANGEPYYLASDGTWNSNETVFGTAQAFREVDTVLPSEAHGEWGFDVIVTGPDGEPAGWGSSRVVAAERPGLRLDLNRSIANTPDPVRLDLLQFNAGDQGLVTPLVLLLLPDGRQITLPGLSFDVEFGESLETGTSRTQTLLDGLPAWGEGEYRLLARLYGEEGKIVAMASAGFLVCDAEAEVSGRVRDAGGQAVDGEAADLAVVEAFELYDGAPAAVTTVAGDGSYSLSVPPGVYSLRAARAVEETYEEAAVDLNVGCNGEPVQVDLQLGQPAEPAGDLTPNRLHFRRRMEPKGDAFQTGGGTLPKAGVFVQLKVPADDKIRTAFLFSGGGQPKFLNSPVDGDSIAQAVNAAGEAVGRSTVGNTGTFPLAWFFPPALLSLDPADGGRAIDINASGQVLIQDQSGGPTRVGRLWENGTLTQISHPASSMTFVHAIDNRGRIVGDYRESGVPRDFIWRSGEYLNPRDLLCPESNGVSFGSLRGMSDSGIIRSQPTPGGINRLLIPDGLHFLGSPLPNRHTHRR